MGTWGLTQQRASSIAAMISIASDWHQFVDDTNKREVICTAASNGIERGETNLISSTAEVYMARASS